MSLLRHTPLRRKAPIRPWRRPKADQVTEAEANYVYARDNGRCLAPLLDHSADPCSGRITLEHVHDGGTGMTGKRAASDRKHMLLLCLHHNCDGWASAHKAWERAYLLRVEGA